MNEQDVVVDTLIDSVYGDSCVSIPRTRIELALSQDLAKNGGVIPTFDEIEKFVQGDEDGCVPLELVNRYTNLHHLLEEYLT